MSLINSGPPIELGDGRHYHEVRDLGLTNTEEEVVHGLGTRGAHLHKLYGANSELLGTSYSGTKLVWGHSHTVQVKD